MRPSLPTPHLCLLFAFACSDYELAGGKGADPGDSGGRPQDVCDEPSFDAPIVDEACLNEPGIGSFDPEVEWSWSENPIYPGYDDVMATPAVGHLDDDDGDGVIGSEGDVPEVVFASFSGGAYTSAGTITAIRGDGSGTVWSVYDAGFYSSSGVAIGDLEGDGWPEVCVSGTSAAVVCLNGADGSVKWSSGSETAYVGCPAIADMNGDGLAEVILGRQIFAHDGTALAVGTEGRGGSYQMSFPVDWDGDGRLEVVAGSTVYEMDGSVAWSDGGNDGIPAVADFDGDGRPDMVRSNDGYVTVVLNDGTQLWRTAVPGGGSGGAPTVADFDGDGQPEVGVAALAYYTMFDTDGAVIWSNATEDDSSSVTGSSVFDFEGDGSAEVVYADEHDLYVYDGATGEVLLQESGHASGTLFEYPLVADVDGDGSTEIIVASNDYTIDGWNGITVVGDRSSSWAPAREVWNQFAYHITNVENDGGIPLDQEPNWESWNNFRAGGTELGPGHWLADLQPETSVCCEEGVAHVYVSIGNGGLLDAAPFEISLVSDAGLVAEETIASLPSGSAATLGPFELDADAWGSELRVVIDGRGAVGECDESDNVVELGAWVCD